MASKRSQRKGNGNANGASEHMNSLNEDSAAAREKLQLRADELEKELDEKAYMLKKLEQSQTGASEIKDLEDKIHGIDRELDEISVFMTGNKHHKKQKKKMKKAANAAFAVAVKQAKKEKKLGKKGELWKSPNTIATVMQLQERSLENIPEGEQIKWVWCMVFDMPETSHAKSNTVAGNVNDSDEDEEHATHTGEDLQEPELKPKISASHAELAISQEAWVACEKIVGADLCLRHVVPMDRRFLIIAVGATQATLIDEATNMKLLMRLQESKGGLEFHPDLMRYYAAFHGGLNEYENFVWKRRAGADLRLHFKDDESLSDRQIEDRLKRNSTIFTSGLAQRCVWNRLNRKGRYSAERQLIIGAGNPKPLGSNSGPHINALKNVQARVKRQRAPWNSAGRSGISLIWRIVVPIADA